MTTEHLEFSRNAGSDAEQGKPWPFFDSVDLSKHPEYRDLLSLTRDMLAKQAERCKSEGCEEDARFISAYKERLDEVLGQATTGEEPNVPKK